MKINSVLLALTALASTAASADDDISFALSTGVPFFVTPEMSYQSQDSETRYYANLKLGLDNGASLGFETPVSENKKHMLGAFIGSVGVRDGDTECDQEPSSSLGETLGNIIGCSLAATFDWETVNGIGASYRYDFSGEVNQGWYTRLELGYGKARESKKNTAVGGFVVGYQF